MKKTGFTVNITSSITMPDIDYINELAGEKDFRLGHSFKKPPKILQDLYFLFKKESEDPLAFDVKNYLFKSDYIESDILKRPLSIEEQAYYKYTLLFLKKIEYDSVIGITPLDKSLNVLMYLTHLTSINPQNNNSSTSNPDPGTVNIEDEESLAKGIQEASKGVSPGGPTNSNNGVQETLSKDITSCVRDHLYDLTPSIAHVYGKRRPADVPINRKILNDIKIKAYLEHKVGLGTSLDVTKKRNNDSKERNRLQMEDHGQVTKVRKTEILKEGFDDKFIKKELIVKEKVKPETKKQIVYMLLDDSGSMACIEKQSYVRAVLLNRLESVVDGKSELKFCLYESQRYQFYDVKDKKSAQDLFKDISLRRPNGGGTNIGAVIQETIDDIHNLPNHHDPEIIIVCDGDDRLYHESVDLKEVTVNAILLGRQNDDIKKLTKRSGGFYTVEDLYGSRGY